MGGVRLSDAAAFLGDRSLIMNGCIRFRGGSCFTENFKCEAAAGELVAGNDPT